MRPLTPLMLTRNVLILASAMMMGAAQVAPAPLLCQLGDGCCSKDATGRGVNVRPWRTARPAPAPLKSAPELHKNNVAVSQLCASGAA